MTTGRINQVLTYPRNRNAKPRRNRVSIRKTEPGGSRSERSKTDHSRFSPHPCSRTVPFGRCTIGQGDHAKEPVAEALYFVQRFYFFAGFSSERPRPLVFSGLTKKNKGWITARERRTTRRTTHPWARSNQSSGTTVFHVAPSGALPRSLSERNTSPGR